MPTIGTTTTILNFPASPIVYGTFVQFQVQVVQSSSPSISPTGTIDLYLNSKLFESQTLTSALGQEVYFNPRFPAGHDVVTAVYSGDSTFSSSTSATMTLDVLKSPTQILFFEPFLSYYGQPVTLFANVSNAGGSAPGAVTFYADLPSGEVNLGTATSVIGSASLTTAALPGGSYSLFAAYAGDANNDPSTSRSDYITVYPARSTTSLSLTPLPSPFGRLVATLTATIAVPSPGPLAPTGSVTFSDGSTVLGTAPLRGATAGLTASLPVGTDTITATYSGDSNYATSPSAPLTQIVGTQAEQYINQVYVDALGRPVDIPALAYWNGRLARGSSREQFVATLVNSPAGHAHEVQAEYQRYLHRAAKPGDLKSALAKSPFSLVALDTLIVGGEEYYLSIGELIPNYLAQIGYAVLHTNLPSSYMIKYATELDDHHAPRSLIAGQLFTSQAGRVARVGDYYGQVFGRAADPQGLNHYIGLLNRGAAPEQVLIGLLSSNEFYATFTAEA